MYSELRKPLGQMLIYLYFHVFPHKHARCVNMEEFTAEPCTQLTNLQFPVIFGWNLTILTAHLNTRLQPE